MAEKNQLYKELRYIPIDSLFVSDWNVRKHQVSKGVEELAKSIEEIGGLLQPLVVFPSGDKRNGIFRGQVPNRRFRDPERRA